VEGDTFKCTSSHPSSAHLSAFSLRNSPLWALILINMVKRPILTLWWRTLMMRAIISPSGECRRRGSFPSSTQFEATVKSPLESVMTTMGWSWVRESSRARHAAAYLPCRTSHRRRLPQPCSTHLLWYLVCTNLLPFRCCLSNRPWHRLPQGSCRCPSSLTPCPPSRSVLPPRIAYPDDLFQISSGGALPER